MMYGVDADEITDRVKQLTLLSVSSAEEIFLTHLRDAVAKGEGVSILLPSGTVYELSPEEEVEE